MRRAGRSVPSTAPWQQRLVNHPQHQPHDDVQRQKAITGREVFRCTGQRLDAIVQSLRGVVTTSSDCVGSSHHNSA